MDKNQRIGVLVVVVCLVLAAVVALIPKDDSVKVKDAIGDSSSQRQDPPLLNEQAEDKVTEKVSNLLRTRTAEGVLEGGEKWRFESARTAQEQISVRDADGRATTYDADASAGSGDTLIIETTGRVSAEEAQELAREVLVDPELEVLAMEGRGSRYFALRSAKLVAGPVQISRTQVLITGLFSRELCVGLTDEDRARKLGLTLSCDLSVAPVQETPEPDPDATPIPDGEY